MGWGKLVADLYNYVVPTGLIVPDTTDPVTGIQAQVTAEYVAAFGLDLITSPNSPAGLLIVAETMARTAVIDNNAALANQINPFLAGGVYLDALMALTGVQRIPVQYSLVAATITGVPGTFLAAGSLAAETVNQQQFALVSSVTIPVGGIVSGQFQAVLPGAITCGAGDLTQIISNILGWETVTNPAAATVGAQAQPDLGARQLRVNALFAQGASLAGAIIANVELVPGVNSMTFLENVAATTQTIDGVTMISHSMYACVSGGTDLAVATAIAQKKSGGCSYNNGASSSPKSIPVTQPISGQIINVLFDRPDMIPVIATVTCMRGTAVTPDLNLSIQAACYNWAEGVNGIPGNLTVGANLTSFELAAAITAAIPGIYISNIQVSTASPVSYSNVVAAQIWQQLLFLNFNSITTVIT